MMASPTMQIHVNHNNNSNHNSSVSSLDQQNDHHPIESSGTRLQVSLSAQNLHNIAGMFSISDPFAVVTIRGDDIDNRPYIAGQTEVIYNKLNPVWATVVFLEGYKFGLPFYIEVGVFDFQAKRIGQNEKDLAEKSSEVGRLITSDASTRNLLKTGKLPYALMGTALFEVGDILGQRGNMASKLLQTGGVVYVHVERSRDDGAKGKLRFQLRGLKLHNTQTLGRKSSPFYELYRKTERPSGAIWSSVYRSNVARKDLTPKWEATELSLESTCNGDLDRPMKVIVYDHRRTTGRHKIIGELETTMRGFIEVKQSGGDVDEDKGFTLLKHGKNTGHILVTQANLLEEHGVGSDRRMGSSSGGGSGRSGTMRSSGSDRSTNRRDRPAFLDYLAADCQISLAVAIDFTASNGDPREEGTPHYFYPPTSNQWNDYQKAMYAVGTILAKYDNDQHFPIWGFGAKYNGQVRHCFQVGQEVEVKGVEGIMEAYKAQFNTTLTMSYPTVFTDVIRTAARYAQHEQEENAEQGKLSYTILLILTAGDVKDVDATKRELIAASTAPLSIVIVGIGDHDFAAMLFLDDHDPDIDGGRDITKFVKFSDFRSFNLLTEAVLDEIPDQLVTYFYEKGIMPGKATQVQNDDVHIMEADGDDRTATFLG